MSLLIVGSLALDTIETPAGSVENVPGGSTTYSSLAASYFTHPRIVGVVGDDFPASMMTIFKEHHFDLTGLQTRPGKTFRWGARYAENFDERTTLFTELNVFENYIPKIPAIYRDASHVLLANIHPALQNSVLEQMTSSPFVIMDTMNLWINIATDELMELLKKVSLLVINDEEARMLTGLSHPGHAAARLRHFGPEWIVIKRGQHGALLFHEDDIFSVPAVLLDQVVDPTGAGDSFVGALAGYLDQSQIISFDNLKLAVVYGTILASLCVEDFSVNAMIYLEEEDIEERYDRLVVMSQF